MLHIGALIILTIFAFLTLKKILRANSSKKEKRLKCVEFEYADLSEALYKLIEENRELERQVNETIALHNLTRELCKTLDENKILTIFKERISGYFKPDECRFVERGADLSAYKTEAIFPLVIQQDTAGYLVAPSISDKEKAKLQILVHQFLIGFKRALLYKKMQELSIMDSLTRLFSRRHFLERAAEELLRSKKFKYKLSFLMADIDRFKGFNDKYGHLVGDAILREVSKTFKETVRLMDFVGRYGGEELSVILVETDKEQARYAAQRIRQAVESRNIKVYDEELKVSVSIGIATFPDDADNVAKLIEAADQALYQAKQSGRNRVEIYRK